MSTSSLPKVEECISYIESLGYYRTTRRCRFYQFKILDKSKIEEFLTKTSPSTNQGTYKEILWRKLYLENIRKISINNEVYKVIA